MEKPLPTLRELLGDGARADGFEDFVRDAMAKESTATDPGVRATGRVIRILTVALVEAGRIEQQERMDPVDTMMRLGRGLGVALMAAMVGRGPDDMPIDEAKEVGLQLVREGADWFVSTQQ